MTKPLLLVWYGQHDLVDHLKAVMALQGGWRILLQAKLALRC